MDWIKLSRREVLDEEMTAAGTRPMLLHTLPHLGARSLLDGAPDWRGTVERLARARSPHVAAHLAFLDADGDAGSGDERIRARVVANLRTPQDVLPVPVLVENQPFYATRGTHRLTVDPDFIRSVVEETDVGVLLDTAHVRVAASHLRVDAGAYLRALPLERNDAAALERQLTRLARVARGAAEA